jgi:type II secretion system protein N
MANPLEFLEAPIPRPLLWAGVPIAAAVLITVLVFLRFPYGEFAPALSAELTRATGREVSVGDIEPRLTIGGPGIAARDVRILLPSRQRIDIDPLRLRPAWSTSWLQGDPALKVEAESLVGNADGIVVIGDVPAWRGEIVEVDLGRLPFTPGEGIALSGRMTAAADLQLLPDGPSGPLSFDATAGSIDHPALPIGIAYETATGDLLLGGDAIVDVRAFNLDGPVLSASAIGTVRQGPRPGDPQLDLDVDLEIKNAPMRALVQGLGVQLDARGRSSFAIQGTTSSPRMR